MFSTCITEFLFGADLYEYRLVEGFVDENMVFGDYVSEYPSDGDQK